jgi:hypothetical protein
MPKTKVWTPTAIAEESALIRGFHLTAENAEDPEYKALVGLYKDILGSSEPKLVNPLIINIILCDTKGWVKWRNGIPAEFRGLPKAEYCQALFSLWWRRLERDIERARTKSASYRALYVQIHYATFLCIRPFRNGNGGTALLMWYMLRRYLSLPLVVVTYDDAPRLNMYVRTFRKRMFLPTLAHSTMRGSAVLGLTHT